MKARSIFLTLIAGMSLVSCASQGETTTSDSSAGTSEVNPSNTLISVLSSIQDNCTVTNVFQFINVSSGTANVVTNYVKEGYYSTFNKDAFGTESNTGFISDDSKTYACTITKDEVTLGEELLDSSGNSVSSFRDLYYDPSYIGDNASSFAAENVFSPRIKGTTYGTFDLPLKVYGEDKTTVVKDNTEILITLAKCLGVYEIASSYADVVINAAELYFSANGKSTYNFKFYFTYKDGYDRLTALSNVTKIGSTSIKGFTNYFKSKE